MLDICEIHQFNFKGPEEPLNYLWLAELYVDIGMREEGRAVLRDLMQKPIPPADKLLWAVVRKQAADLLTELDLKV